METLEKIALKERKKADRVRTIENWAIPISCAAAAGAIEYFTGTFGQLAYLYNGIDVKTALSVNNSYNVVSALFSAAAGAVAGVGVLGAKCLLENF